MKLEHEYDNDNENEINIQKTTAPTLNILKVNIKNHIRKKKTVSSDI